jgi:putative cell wall-binding protein
MGGMRLRFALLLVFALFGAALLPRASAPALAEEGEASPTPSPSPSPTSAPCDETDPDGYRRLVDLTFPVRGDVTYIDDYHHVRSGGARRHQGTDLMARKLQTVHAAVGGVVEVATGIDGPVPSYGYYLKVRHDDGTAAAYVHLNNDTPGTDDGRGGHEWAYAPGIRKGVRVERGQWIGYVGDSGNAEGTTPHLHFELHDPELDDPACLPNPPYDPHRLNPYDSLKDAERRSDFPPPPPVGRVQRVAGSNRVLTAVEVSKAARSTARTVVVVPEGSHVEALVAAPLAGLVDGPVLLSGPAGLDDAVAGEVRRLGARNAYVIGRAEQLSTVTEDDLRAAGVQNLARIAEPDPYALSAALARELASYPEVDGFERVFLALGEHADPSRAWPDALSAGALAAAVQAPVLLTRGEELPPAIARVLADLRPRLVQVVGGAAAVSEAVSSAAGEAAGAVVTRLAGANRFATSVAVARAAVDAGLAAPRVWAATGHAFPDALAAGPAAARLGAPLVLVDGRRAGGAPEPEAWLADETRRIEEGIVVGGVAAVSEDVRAHLAKLLAG